MKTISLDLPEKLYQSLLSTSRKKNIPLKNLLLKKIAPTRHPHLAQLPLQTLIEKTNPHSPPPESHRDLLR